MCRVPTDYKTGQQAIKCPLPNVCKASVYDTHHKSCLCMHANRHLVFGCQPTSLQSDCPHSDCCAHTVDHIKHNRVTQQPSVSNYHDAFTKDVNTYPVYSWSGV